MGKHEAIVAVLQAYGIDPDQVVETDTNERTAFEIIEAHILAALDEIEEGTPE